MWIHMFKKVHVRGNSYWYGHFTRKKIANPEKKPTCVYNSYQLFTHYHLGADSVWIYRLTSIEIPTMKFRKWLVPWMLMRSLPVPLGYQRSWFYYESGTCCCIPWKWTSITWYISMERNKIHCPCILYFLPLYFYTTLTAFSMGRTNGVDICTDNTCCRMTISFAILWELN